jgi:nicotinate-nucleotide pyrophosphorylase (carboxylating)
VGHRLVDGPFVYIDKNAVHLAGGIVAATTAGRRLDHGPVSVQVATPDEAIAAVGAGAGIVMVDTGVLADLSTVDAALRSRGWRDDVLLAFGGGVRRDDLDEAQHRGAQIVDIGRAVLDAPLWDLRLEMA